LQGKVHIAFLNGTIGANWRMHRRKNNHNVLPCNSLLIFGLFSVIFLFYVYVYLPTQIYGITGSAGSCNLMVNQTCRETPSVSNSAAMSDSEKNAKIPLILPDISPTETDLNDIENDEDVKTADNAEFDDASSRDSSVDNRDTNEESEKEASNEVASESGKDSGNGDLSLPFP
jgi:hypothetical protein